MRTILLFVSFGVLLAMSSSASGSYEITVKRGPGTEGKLTCTVAGITNVTCYWKKDKRIPAKSYLGCSTTIMSSKGYNAVFIPDVPGFTGIFIHQGSGPSASDGCIVTAKEHVEKIWNAIPRDKKNITVRVIDE